MLHGVVEAILYWLVGTIWILLYSNKLSMMDNVELSTMRSKIILTLGSGKSSLGQGLLRHLKYIHIWMPLVGLAI